ncbi:hypothetical protein [Rhabdochlamydiaceae symbiont of Dictyostelium giganteum]|uniref:hypothetical protein n=1 Tax=Rhabdochlamydiaceae symbiont of Dictyostelium giganteum TaxID=3342349 RepID=UPI00384F36E8
MKHIRSKTHTRSFLSTYSWLGLSLLCLILSSCSQDKPKDDIHFGPTPCDQVHEKTFSD